MVFIHPQQWNAALERRQSTPDGPAFSDYMNEFFGLICILLILILMVGTFFLIRRYRNSTTAELPLHKDDLKAVSKHQRSSNTLSCQPSFVMREKEAFLASTYSPPPSTPPAIHLTLPEELEDGTKTASARIVVVSIGEHGEIGLSPLAQEQLPAYQEHAPERFTSLDMERLGGLKENQQK